MRIKTVLVGILAVAAAVLYVRLKASESPEPALATVLLEGVPHVRQKPDFCGEACAAMWLGKLGEKHDQDDVFDISGLDPALGRGLHTRELAAALQRIGFETGEVWHKVAAEIGAVEALWRDLHADLVRGVPSIVCMRYDESPDTTEHFRLVLGYDAGKDEVVYHEPALDKGAYRRMDRARFLSLWPLKYETARWTLIRLGLGAKGDLAKPPAPRKGARFTNADYAQHVIGLKKKLPHDGFTIVVERPFVVIGDQASHVVRMTARRTVRWAAEMLKEAYFDKDPLHILDVWLFKDKDSYETNAKRLFGSAPSTKFGYYSSADRALVMNIATGTGTLVHEIVHPFIEANFPGCPPWFNEGLGSLYEQCSERHGAIWGLTNWRLKGLKKEIRGGTLPSF
ncbi:MAG: C39 family peptidase [Planctomycetota bacterium]|jgi:hypothetical protein